MDCVQFDVKLTVKTIYNSHEKDDIKYIGDTLPIGSMGTCIFIDSSPTLIPQRRHYINQGKYTSHCDGLCRYDSSHSPVQAFTQTRICIDTETRICSLKPK